MDFRPNLQRFRHGSVAGGLRRRLHAWLVGDGVWPPRFVRPGPGARPVEASANVYVHIPFCLTICPHCPYNKARWAPGKLPPYRAALLAEIAAYLARGDAPPVETLYFGGGTPSLVPELVEEVIGLLRPRLVDGAEIAIEVYPLDATDALLTRLRAAGVNRISLGIETLHAAELKRLGRRYTEPEALAAIDRAKAAGFEMVDVNLIFGIPGQRREAVFEDLRTVLARGVDQVSAYPLFTFDHTPAGQPRQEDSYARAPERERMAMQKGISRICRAAGLARTSVWSFTREGIAPYTTVTRPDYVGFGAGAGSLGVNAMSFNTFPVSAYSESGQRGPALVWDMSPEMARMNWLYWAIYTLRIDAGSYKAQFGRRLEGDFGGLLLLLRALGCLRREGKVYVLTERGAIWVHRMQSLFSLSGIDRVWTTCTKEAWPEEVALF